MTHKAFVFKLEPTKDQELFFLNCMGCARFLYNYLLSKKNEYWEEHKEPLFITALTPIKEEFPWLREVDSLALTNAWSHLNAAYRNWAADRAELPTFKKKGKNDAYTTNNQGGNIRIEGKFIKLPKIGWVKMKLHRQISGKIKSVTVKRSPSGRYSISILCDTTILPFEKTNQAVGVDLGIADLAILSDGTKFPNIKPLMQLKEKLAKEQRILSRRWEANVKERIYYTSGKKNGQLKRVIYYRPLKECKNYQKQKVKVARIHAKIANQRRNYLHQLTHFLVKNYDTIVIEDLAPSNLIKNRKLSRAIADVSWGAFVTFLTYKAEWYGKKVVKISRWHPSSQLCSSCGTSSGKKPLHIREWECPSCGAHHDRDVNAAINILNEGLRIA